MKFQIENWGPVTQAEVVLGDLTVLCGPNNSGKTYVTYAIGIFLHYLNTELSLAISESQVQELLDKGVFEIELKDFIPLYLDAVQKMVEDWRHYLPDKMAMHPERCKAAVFNLELTREELEESLDSRGEEKYSEFYVSNTHRLELCKKANSTTIRTSLIRLNGEKEVPAADLLKKMVEIALAKFFNHPALFYKEDTFYMITCERTGAALFWDQWLISQQMANDNETPGNQFSKSRRQLDFRGYQFPVQCELSYNLELAKIVNRQSDLAKQHPEILVFFDKMIGGNYKYDSFTRQIHFHPNVNSNVGLTLAEVSSTVKSLLKLNFYLKHQASPGQILFFDEPELNLHPSNQCNIARLLAMLVNAGIKVFLTTHSDYIIREFNILLQLNHPRPFLRKIQEREGYLDSELLSASQVKAYVACPEETGVILKSSSVTQEDGILMGTLDEVIEKMNEIHEAIVWGE